MHPILEVLALRCERSAKKGEKRRHRVGIAATVIIVVASLLVAVGIVTTIAVADSSLTNCQRGRDCNQPKHVHHHIISYYFRISLYTFITISLRIPTVSALSYKHRYKHNTHNERTF